MNLIRKPGLRSIGRTPLVPGMKPWPRDRRYSKLVVLMIWLVFATLTLNWGWLDGPVSRNITFQEASAPNPALRFIKLGLLGVSIWMATSQWKRSSQTLRQTNAFFLAFVTLACLSFLWSLSPGDTINRCITLVTLISVCFAFTLTNWYRERVQTVLRPVLVVICLGSLVVGWSMPTWIVDGTGLQADSWHGLFTQKNTFGQVAGFAAVLSLHGLVTREIKPWRAIVELAIAGPCLILSRSSTSLIATVFSVWLMLMLLKSPKTMRRSLRYVVMAFAVIVVLYAVTVLKIVPGLEVLLQPIVMFTGKDMTFTNRSVVWEIVKEHMARWPVMGAGYGGYWIGLVPSSPSYEFLQRMGGFYPTQCHNGYLETANDLGYVGLGILLGYLAVFVRQGIRMFELDRGQGALFLALFFHQSVINLSESTWFRYTEPIDIIVMTVVTFAMARTLAEFKRTGQLPPRKRV